MSDFIKNENANYQAELRKMLQDLELSLDRRGCRWGEWERKFIKDMALYLNQDIIVISTKQYAKVFDLWERSLK